MIHPIFPRIWLEAIVRYAHSCPESLRAEGGVLAINQGPIPVGYCGLLRHFQNVYVIPSGNFLIFPTSHWKHRSKLLVP